MIRYLSKTNPRALKGVALLRLDFNTENDWRMMAVLGTVRFLLRYASQIVIVSHKGRPAFVKTSAVGKPLADKSAGKPNGFDKRLSLRKDVKDLEKMLGRKVHFVPHFDFKKIKEGIAQSPQKSVFVLENIRFLKEESTPKPELAKRLASLADYYVNDAFAVSHREADSVAKIERFLPAFAGLELEKELHFLEHIFKQARRPIVFVIGGGKASDKAAIIKSLHGKVDLFLFGGAVANTILFLKGMNMKNSLRDRDRKDLKSLKPIPGYSNVCLPVDFKWRSGAILDIGPESAKMFGEQLKNARTIFWNGPMGFIEKKGYENGTLAVAKAIVKNRKALTLAGGGETVMFLKKHKLDKKFSFISTGGGAMLEFLAGKKLPGIEALKYGKK